MHNRWHLAFNGCAIHCPFSFSFSRFWPKVCITITAVVKLAFSASTANLWLYYINCAKGQSQNQVRKLSLLLNWPLALLLLILHLVGANFFNQIDFSFNKSHISKKHFLINIIIMVPNFGHHYSAKHIWV